MTRPQEETTNHTLVFFPLTLGHDHMLSHRSYNHRVRGPSAPYPLFLPPLNGCSGRTCRGSGNWLLGKIDRAHGSPLENRQKNRGKPPEQICRQPRHVALSFRLEPFYLIHEIHGSDWTPIAVCQTYLHLLCPTFLLDKLGIKDSPILTLALAFILEQP